MRRFRLGDLVRFAPDAGYPIEFGLDPALVGRIVYVDPDYRPSGTSYMVAADFGADGTTPRLFAYLLELVETSEVNHQQGD